MSKDYHKFLVDAIQKYAKPAPDPPPGHVKPSPMPVAKEGPAGPPTAAPTASGRKPVPQPGKPQPQAGAGAGFTGTSQNVMKMQEALINLAKDVTSQLKVEDTTKQQDGKPARESGEAMGRISFSDFITKKYLRQSNVQGVEFPTDKTKTQLSDKTPGTPTRMYSIMDTMNRVGGGGAEFAADGKWGPRTNAALHNANAFAYSMLKLAGDFNIPIKSYTDADRSEFVVPENENDITAQQKNDYAAIYAKHIDAIHKMFGEIKAGILNNPRHQSYIELDQPFVSYKKIVPLSQAELRARESWDVYRLASNDVPFTMAQPGNEAVPLTSKINYSDLVSSQAFSKWLESPVGKSLSQPGVTQPMILAAIRKALQARASGGA